MCHDHSFGDHFSHSFEVSYIWLALSLKHRGIFWESVLALDYGRIFVC